MVSQTPFQPSDYTQRTTKTAGLRQADSHSRGRQTNLKAAHLKSSSEPSACHSRSSFFLYFLLPHPSPSCHGPSRQLTFQALQLFCERESSQHWEHSEQGEPSDSELSQHASLTSWQRRSMAMWQLNATRPSSQSSRKSATTSLDQSCPQSCSWFLLLFLPELVPPWRWSKETLPLPRRKLQRATLLRCDDWSCLPWRWPKRPLLLPLCHGEKLQRGDTVVLLVVP